MSNEIPLLEALDIECRVQSTNKSKSGKVGAILLLYKNARVDMRILDQVFGVNNWQRTHEVINGNLFCNIDIWDEEKKCWVRKQDVGVPSNTEGEKGEASDSFKRAGFNVGIGRELYTAPFIYVQLDEGEYYMAGDKPRLAASVSFEVSQIGYNDRREINSLVIVDNKGRSRYNMGKPVTAKNNAKPAEHICSVCGNPIKGAVKSNGTATSAEEIAKKSMAMYGQPMCAECFAKKYKEDKESK